MDFDLMAIKAAILFNGPPRSGKDTATNAITKNFPDIRFRIVKFTEPVKVLTHKRYGLNVPHDFFDDPAVKDIPLDDFDGLTPRQAYIATSAEVRAVMGEHYFAHMVAEEIPKMSEDVLICPDVGYDFEAEAIVSQVGVENALLGRIYKEGHSFANDCRVRLGDDYITTLDIENIEGEEARFVQTVCEVVRDILAPFSKAHAMARVPELS